MSANAERHLSEELVGERVRDELEADGGGDAVLHRVVGRFHKGKMRPIAPSHITGDGYFVFIGIAQPAASRLRNDQSAAHAVLGKDGIIQYCGYVIS